MRRVVADHLEQLQRQLLKQGQAGKPAYRGQSVTVHYHRGCEMGEERRVPPGFPPCHCDPEAGQHSLYAGCAALCKDLDAVAMYCGGFEWEAGASTAHWPAAAAEVPAIGSEVEPGEDGRKWRGDPKGPGTTAILGRSRVCKDLGRVSLVRVIRLLEPSLAATGKTYALSPARLGGSCLRIFRTGAKANMAAKVSAGQVVGHLPDG